MPKKIIDSEKSEVELGDIELQLKMESTAASSPEKPRETEDVFYEINHGYLIRNTICMALASCV